MSVTPYARRDLLKAMGPEATSLSLPGCSSTAKATAAEGSKGRPNRVCGLSAQRHDTSGGILLEPVLGKN